MKVLAPLRRLEYSLRAPRQYLVCTYLAVLLDHPLMGARNLFIDLFRPGSSYCRGGWGARKLADQPQQQRWPGSQTAPATNANLVDVRDASFLVKAATDRWLQKARPEH